jgi:hypothetical protein
MSNSHIFFYPGNKMADFVCSLFGTRTTEIDPELYWVISLLLTLFIWSYVLRICVAIIKKAFGFEPRR